MAKKSLDKVFAALGKQHEQLAACFKSRGDDFQDVATAHSQAAAVCADGVDASKSLDDTLSKGMIPDSISGIPRSDVPDSGFGIRAIPRTGQPDPSGLDKAEIDAVNPMFRHLVQTAED